MIVWIHLIFGEHLRTVLKCLGITAIALIAFGFEPLNAQVQYSSFVLYNIDTTAFPRVTASLYAIDIAQARYRSFTVSDLDLYEDGQLKNSSMSISCDTSDKPIPIAVCLSFDQSFSMADKTPAGDTYWDWAAYGGKMFIDTLNMVPPTCVAITSFGGNAYVRAPFQTTKPPLYAALGQIPIQGGTNYDEAFLNTSAPNGAAGAVAILRNAPLMLRRYMIILTDGQPDKQPSKQRIIDSCIANGITVFAINMFTPRSQNVNPDLFEICTKTGGRAFLAHSKAEIAVIYKLIAAEMQRNIDCRVTWTSATGCGQNSRLRSLRAVLKRATPPITWRGTYMASVNSVADPIPSVSTLSFEDPGSGNSVIKRFTVKAPAGISIRINSLVSSLPLFYRVSATSKTLPATLLAGESMDIDVEFIQSTSGSMHNGVLSINGTPCSQSINLNVIIPVLKLETPVGGESLDGCDSIPIRWSGIAEDEAITVMASWDNGTKWKVLDAHASGLHYSWFHRVEHNAGTDNLLPYKIKVQRSSCRWLSTFGGIVNDSAKSLCLNSLSTNLGVGGSFENSIRYAATQTASFGKRDGFFAVMTQNGVQRSLIPFGGTENDEVVSVDADPRGNFVIAGNSYSGSIRCGDSTLIVAHPLTSSGFVACVDTLGKTLWAIAIADSTGLNLGEMIISSVYAKPDSSYAVQGYQRGVIQSIYTASSTTKSTSFDAPNLRDLYFPVSIDISKTGKVVRFLSGFFYPLYTRASTTAMFNNTQVYQCGTFNASIQCAQSTSPTSGMNDGFVRAVSLNPGSDQSAKSFSILNPLAWFESAKLSMQQVDVGQSLVYPAGQPFRNDGTPKMNLLKFYPVGIDSADFSVDPPLAPGVINAHSNPEIRIRITPRPVSRTIRNAYLVAISECSEPAFIRIESYAKFPNLMMTGTSFGRKRIGSINYDTMHILNNDPGAIPLKTLGSKYNQWNEFQWSVKLPSDSIIPAHSDLPIVVKFVPTHIEEDSLEVHVDTSIAVRIRASAVATGSGFLPRQSTSGYRFQTVAKGRVSTEQGRVLIRNIDTLSALRIYSSHWRNNQSDDFHSLRNVPDTSIAPGDSIVIPVEYYPLSAGLHRAYYVFEHDAAPGPDPLPRALDTVIVEADASELIVDSTQLRFPTILSCDSADLDFRISNKAAQTSVTLTRVDLIQNGSNFSVSPIGPLNIAAGASQTVHLDYNPSTLGPSTALIILHYGNGQKSDTLRVSANSVTASLSIAKSDTTFRADIGSKYLVHIVGNLTASTAFVLDTISFDLTTNPSQARFAVERFVTSSQGWTWSIDSIGSRYIFSGRYLGAALTNPIHFADLPFDVYLSQNLVNTMSVHTLAENVKECLLTDSAHITINENEVCFTRGASVQARTLLSLQLNHLVSGSIGVQYSLSEAADARIELFNSLGSCVLSQELAFSAAGRQEQHLNVQHLSPGLYFCRIRTRGQSETASFMLLP